MDRSRELCTVSAGYGASKENSVSQVPRTGGTIHQEVTVRGKIDTREMEQAQLFETADERGCTPMFGAGHRRASAVPYPRRYEARSLDIVSDPHTPMSATDETDLRGCPSRP